MSSAAPSPLFKLPELPVNYIDLEPFVDCQTMYFHHQKHHATYVKNLNDALAEAHISSIDLIDTINSPVAKIRNNGGGHYNHSLFWNMLAKPGSSNAGPSGEVCYMLELSDSFTSFQLKSKIDESFGSLENFKSKFSAAAASQFGSGYAWLGVKEDRTLAITTTANQDNPFFAGHASVQMVPFMTFDVWEHAYYLKYANRRVDYINSLWNIVNWDKITELYNDYASNLKTVSFSC